LIRNSPLILNKWSVNMSLSKDDVKKVPVWVKMLKVPVVAYTEDGLSRITSQIGRPIMVDSFTSEMCDATWGRMGYARALIEISADKALKQEVVMVVPIEDGAGHTLERIKLEYEWKPPLCLECHVLGHDSNSCPKKAHEAVKPSSNSGLETKQQDGFTTLTHKKKKTKNHANVQPKQFGGLKLNKPTSTMVWNKKATQPERVEKANWWRTRRLSGVMIKHGENAKHAVSTINESDSEEVDEDINLEEPPGQAMSHANKGNSVPHVSYFSSASIARSVFMFYDALECIPIKYCLLLWRQLDMRFLVRGCTEELEALCRLHWSKAEFIIFDFGLTN
ncbi:putative reverse transcriptase domain-containing protein, partial [Tanacetum coccineum]